MCLQLGIDDPERWLATRPKRVVHLWEAYWQLEPWGLTWHRHAMWMQMLDRIYGLLFTWIGGKDWKPSTFADWMPTDWRDSSQDRRKKLPLRDQLKIVAAAFKGKHGSDK